MRCLALLLLLPVAVPQDSDPAAMDLLKKAGEKAAAAKSMRVKFRIHSAGEGELVAGEYDVYGDRMYRLSAKSELGGDHFELRSDGRRTKSGGPGRAHEAWERVPPDRMVKVLRSGPGLSVVGCYGLLEQQARDRDSDPQKVAAAKLDGKEKVGDVEATVVAYQLDGVFQVKLNIKAWIDPATGRVLRRQLNIEDTTLEETIDALEFDTLKEEDFLLVSGKTLLDGRKLMLRRSIELFTRFTGHAPKDLKDLVDRPAWLPPDIFYPAGGFWNAGPMPEASYRLDGNSPHFEGQALVAATRQAIVAPTERLARHFEARIQVARLAAAVEGFRTAYLELPKKAADLWTKPEWASWWPEGGWIRDAKLPVDPWGEAMRLITYPSYARIQVKDPKARRLLARDLTPEERAALEKGAAPRFTAEESAEVERLIDRLREDDLEVRETAERKLKAWGPCLVAVLKARLPAEADDEVRARFHVILEALPAPSVAWTAELRPLAAMVTLSGAEVSVGESEAAMSLKTLATAEADFRSNDRDGNMMNDFWVRDVSGLCNLEPADAATAGKEATAASTRETAIRLIEYTVAAADATPGRLPAPKLDWMKEEPQPKTGYVFAAIPSWIDDAGKEHPYDTGPKDKPALQGRCADRFGFMAYPAEYGVGGLRTFAINEDNVVWWKDLEGEPLRAWPADPAAAGWRRTE